MKLKLPFWLALASVLAMAGCSSDSDGDKGDNGTNGGNGSDNGSSADMLVTTRIDDQTGFLNAIDSSSSSMDNGNGVDINPNLGLGVYHHNGFIYVSGSLVSNKIFKYRINEDNSMTLVDDLDTVTAGSIGIPTSFTFADDSKAYLPMAGTGELLVLNLDDFSISNRIDLTPYALDEDLTLYSDGGNDNNPEPSAAVIRTDNGTPKLYVSLAQVNALGHAENTFICRGMASLVIVDIATDTVDKHITDPRTCTSGSISPGSELTLDDNGDIYVNNTASFGYSASHPPGYLRVKAGETEFDQDYFFNLRELDLTGDFPDMDPSMAVPSYVYKEKYHNGLLYMTMFILGLTTEDPNDFVANKNYQPYTLDLVNQTATKLATPPTNGWSAQVAVFNDTVVFPMATTEANGLYRADETTPFMSTEGQPLNVVEIK